MKDFGNETYSGDYFVLVGLIMGLNSINTFDFIEIMKQINHDLHLGLEENTSSRTYRFRDATKISRYPLHRAR